MKRILVVGSRRAFEEWESDNPELKESAVRVWDHRDCYGVEASGIILLYDAHNAPVSTDVLRSRVRK